MSSVNHIMELFNRASNEIKPQGKRFSFYGISLEDGSLVEFNPYNRPHIVCHDGSVLSIQANRSAYCSPRRDDGPYSEVEILSEHPIAEFEDYFSEPDSSSDYFMYGFVPTSIVEGYIQKCGGVNLPAVLARILQNPEHYFIDQDVAEAIERLRAITRNDGAL